MMPAHPSAVILAALLADLQNHPLTGKDLIEAHVVGVEVGGKIGLGITTVHYHRGFTGQINLAFSAALPPLQRLTVFLRKRLRSRSASPDQWPVVSDETLER